MFLQYYGLKFNPFGKELDLSNAYESNDIKELKSRFKYIQASRGIFLLIGESGTGKSTALRMFAKGLNPGIYKSAYFTLSTVTVMDFYRGLLMSLGEIPSHKKVTMFHQIQESICTLYYDQKITPVIILDEAQLVSSAILEDIRLLLSFKMDSENPFIFILSGQPPIRSKLNLAVNAPLKQRIGVKYMMQGLKRDELTGYLDSRFKAAGREDNVFTPAGMEAVCSLTKGITRAANNLVTASLMYGCSKRLDQIDEETVYQAYKDIEV